MTEQWSPTDLTRNWPTDERLRLALIDHGLGRMTADAWAELTPELVRGVDTDAKDGLKYAEHELDEARGERDEFEREADALTEGLKAAFAWLERHRDATAGEALIALADLNPDGNDPDDIGREAGRIMKLLTDRK